MSCVIEGLEADRLAALAEARRLRDENGELRAEVADLKARLKAVRAEVYGTYGTTAEQDALVGRATDLRVKNWREP